MRLIDADTYYRLYCDLYEGNVSDGEMDRMAFVTQRVPTIDPESLRPKGRWVSVDGTESCDEWDCTACEQRRTFEWEMELEDMMEHYAYCPSCGAKMEG